MLKEHSFIDGIILGDLESTCYELIYKKSPLQTCHGMATMRSGIININKKPELIDLVNMPKANRSISTSIEQAFVEVSFSKGCLFNCSFCSEIEKKPVRFKPIEEAVEEIEYLNKDLGFKYFTIKDLSFEDRGILLGREQLHIFANKIIEKNLDIYYTVHFRANSFSKEDKPLLNRLRESGLNDCLVGIESFSDFDLEFYNKGVKGCENVNFIELLKECCIEPSCSFMFIHPAAEMEEIKFNFEQAHKLDLLAFLPPSLNVMVVYKKTRIFERLREMNLAYIQEENPYEVSIQYKNLSVRNIADVFIKFYMNKKTWDLYYPIKRISIDLRDLEFKYGGKPIFEKDLINEIHSCFFDINESNYNTILQIIELCEESSVSRAERVLEEYNKRFDNLYSQKLRRFRILLKKELIGNEKLYEMVRKKCI